MPLKNAGGMLKLKVKINDKAPVSTDEWLPRIHEEKAARKQYRKK